MIGVAVALLMNLRFGIKVQHYGLAILSALMGRAVALRQISFHICPEFPPFGEPVFGLDLYVWSFFVFSCSQFAVAVLLILYGFSKNGDFTPVWGKGEKLAFGAVCLLSLANIYTSLSDCGFGPCG
jgi:hypothetical protein